MSPNAAAVDDYERGRVAMAHRTPESLRAAAASFGRALAADARFAAAYVGLADANSMLASDGVEDPRQAMPRSREAANRALTLDPGLATAHYALGRTTMLFDWDWKIAVWHFERGRDLAPANATGRQWFAYCYSAMAQPAVAESEARAALALEPLSLPANTTLGYVLYAARRYQDAEVQLRRTLELDPGYVQARRILGLALVKDGRPAEAIPELERAVQISGDAPSAMADLAMARGRAGDGAGARRLLTRLMELHAHSAFVAPDGIAQVHWGLGDNDQAVQWLQRAFEVRVSTVAHLMADPLWDDLRGDPRVGVMIEAIKNGKAPAAPLP
jgi:serine/threonine-protein kinase